MNKAFEKILEFIDEQIKIEESIAKSENEGHPITHQYGANCMNVIKKFVQEVAEEYNNGWIPCSERLPEEPEEGLTDLDECDEYIAMIENADIPTALNYAGNGERYRDGEFYKVIAWKPLPEPYKESNRKDR